MSGYKEKLKDPKWQRQRLQILERDDWACRVCGDGESTLIVHHRDYLQDKDPWDYPDSLLVTLCEDCHAAEKERYTLEQSVIHLLRKHFFINDLFLLNDGLERLNISKVDGFLLAETLRWFFDSPTIINELINRCCQDSFDEAKDA